MDSVESIISQVLSGTHSMTSGEIESLIKRTKEECGNVENDITADGHIKLDMSVIGDKLEAVKQRLATNELHRDRLEAAIPRLEKYRDDLKIAVRDEAQQAEYKLVVKQIAVNDKEINAFYERAASLARALHEAVRLKEAIKRFNYPPTPSSTVNPRDIMVSGYDHLTISATDALLLGTRLAAVDGTVLFATINTSVSMPSPMASSHQSLASQPYLQEELQQAIEMRVHDTIRLHALRRTVAQRDGPDLTHVAAVQGIMGDQLQRMEDSVNSKFVTAIQHKIDVEMDRRKQVADS